MAWVKVTKRGLRFGASIGNTLRIGVSDGTGGLRVSGSAKAAGQRIGISKPVGGSKRRRTVWYGHGRL